jgi:DNA-binding response OmpR family regulator
MEYTRATILLVEDDAVTRQFLADNLSADGYEIVEAGDFHEAEQRIGSSFPDLAIVDIGLPDRDGLELLARVRNSDRVASRIDPDLPVVILSGRATELDRLRGFSRGCDDYVTKPFSYAELRARIGAVLRRRERRSAAGRLRIGPLVLDAASRQAWLDGELVHLSSKEFSLLRTLAGDPSRVFTREELLQLVWGFKSAGTTRTLDTHACRLRRKLGVRGGGFVVNVWGVGYRLLDANLDPKFNPDFDTELAPNLDRDLAPNLAANLAANLDGSSA